MIQVTDHGDGSADFTITTEASDHRFSVSGGHDPQEAILSYEESRQHWMGDIRISQPDESVFKTLMQSDEMTEFLNRHGYRGIKREARQ